MPRPVGATQPDLAAAKKKAAQKTTAKKSLAEPTVTSNPGIYLPAYLAGAYIQSQNVPTTKWGQSTQPPEPATIRYLPDQEDLLSAHQESLESRNMYSGGDKFIDNSLITATQGTQGEAQYAEVNVAFAGTEGSLHMQDTLLFDPTAMPEETLDYSSDILLPPTPGISDPYPIQFYFKRDLNYADWKGRILRMEYIVTMGFSWRNWLEQEEKNPIVVNDANRWNKLKSMSADAVSASLLIDGKNLTQESYVTFASADGTSMSFDELYQTLSAETRIKDLDTMMLLQIDSGAGSQYRALNTWLDIVDQRRWDEAHPDLPWYKDVGNFAWGVGKSVYNNTVGAVYQAGLQLADMERLWMTIWMRKLGIVDDDYTPSMWSDMGKAAEQGAGTTDLLVGAVKNTVLAPYRFVKAAQRGDWEAAGEGLGDTAFAVHGAKGAVKSAPKFARASYRGLQALRNWKAAMPKLKQGMQDFHSGLREKFSPANSHINNPNVKTMAGTGGPLGSASMSGPSGPSGPRPPHLQLADDIHYNWVDQLREATQGKGSGPEVWQGKTPELDAQGVWRGDNPAEAYAAYQEGLHQSGNQFEVIFSRNRNTGQYQVMIGKRVSVNVPRTNQIITEWDTVMHYHPNLENAPRFSLPAPKDGLDAFQRNANAPHPNNRPHIEFVESVLDGKPTRVAIVVEPNGKVTMDVLNHPYAGTHISNKVDYQPFWYKQNDVGAQGPLPPPRDIKGTRWVPSGSQTARSLLLNAADELGHKDVAQHIKDNAPESDLIADTRTQSGVGASIAIPLDSVALTKTLTRQEIIAQSPPGSLYHSLKDFGLPPRFTNPIADEDVADLKTLKMIKNAEQLREIMKTGRLAGALSNNGGPIDPTQDMSGTSYWLVIQDDKKQLWMCPSYLFE